MSRHSARDPLPPIDERLVMPESGAEILEGRVLIVPGADPPHASRHLTLAYLLAAHTAPGFVAAIDMLTRTSARSDFAPDASVYPSGPDPDTGGRRLELLAVEIVSQQRLGVSTAKARELSRRGVQQVIAVVVAKNRALSWDGRVSRWRPLHPDEVIESTCLAPPIPVRALLDTTVADASVLAAIESRRPDLVAEIESRAEARATARATSRLREKVLSRCRERAIELAPEHVRALDRAGLDELVELYAALELGRWPR